MARVPGPPPMNGLRRKIAEGRQNRAGAGEGRFVRETFMLPREDARAKAREWFDNFPKAAYWTEVESWRQLPDGAIEFTMRRLPSAD
jgi:hypothetical protein